MKKKKKHSITNIIFLNLFAQIIQMLGLFLDVFGRFWKTKKREMFGKKRASYDKVFGIFLLIYLYFYVVCSLIVTFTIKLYRFVQTSVVKDNQLKQQNSCIDH